MADKGKQRMRRLALLGASGHGKVVADVAECIGWEQVEFFDDSWPAKKRIGHWNISGGSAALIDRISEFDGLIVSIGNCAVRMQKQAELEAAGGIFATLAHPSSAVSRYARLGRGTVIMAGAVINADAVIGDACIVNTGASVDHDCELGNGVHVSPGARLAGNVIIGPGTWIGIGAVVRQGIKIGNEVIVGAGAVVVKPVADSVVVVGCPAVAVNHES